MSVVAEVVGDDAEIRVTDLTLKRSQGSADQGRSRAAVNASQPAAYPAIT